MTRASSRGFVVLVAGTALAMSVLPGTAQLADPPHRKQAAKPLVQAPGTADNFNVPATDFSNLKPAMSPAKRGHRRRNVSF